MSAWLKSTVHGCKFAPTFAESARLAVLAAEPLNLRALAVAMDLTPSVTTKR